MLVTIELFLIAFSINLSFVYAFMGFMAMGFRLERAAFGWDKAKAKRAIKLGLSSVIIMIVLLLSVSFYLEQ